LRLPSSAASVFLQGDALIAVNDYLNWMKSAEEESEESDGEPIIVD